MKGVSDMKQISMGGKLQVGNIGLGFMRLPMLSVKEAEHLLRTALEEGITLMDHADIYGRGRSEELFAEALADAPSVREQMVIQSKCAIRGGWYDFDKEHILKSVDGILKRLRTDYLDILLLHRPDALMEPEEVAEAFDQLQESGKVRYFGVSNQNPMQMELLQKYLKQPLIANQMQMSITQCPMIDAGFNVNVNQPLGTMYDGSVIEYCRLKDITVQAWSPFQYGRFEGCFLGSEKYPELNQVIDRLAEKYNTTNSGIAIAWILRHPAGIVPILGTTNADRVKEVCRISDLKITKEEWYELYKAAGKVLP